MKKHNKSMEIRKAARELVSQGKTSRPSEIVARLKAKGIVTASPQVSQALRYTEFALRKPDLIGRATRSLTQAQALKQVSIEDVIKAREFVKEMGTLEKAVASIVALGQFKGGHTPNTPPQTPQMEENKVAEIQAAEQHMEYPADLGPNDDWASRHYVNAPLSKDKK